MAGVKCTYTVIGEQALQALTGLDLRTRNMMPVMQDFAGYMLGSVQKNYDAQGRPVKWVALKPVTSRNWLFKLKGNWTPAGNLSKEGRIAKTSRLILTDTSDLRNSINFSFAARSVEGSTNKKYAAIQHLGGTINIPGFGPKNKKALAWPGAAHPVQFVKAHQVTIPARPFLMFQEQEDVYGYLAGDIVLTESGLLLVLLNRFPAVLVEIGAAAYQPGGHPFFTQEVTATLHVCSRSLRSQEEARGGEAGAYTILHDLRSRLLGQKLREDLQPLLITDERKAATGLTEANEYIVVYVAQYKFTNPRIQQF